ncbi:MAG TPA: polysaccharide-degrading enzyme, partial [Planctomycetaceae bacterium]|nr:polysaccharide-degrading enzyme [Planctomycetaceae bacterium]
MIQPDRVYQRYLRLRRLYSSRMQICLTCILFCLFTTDAEATIYEVGPGKKYSLVEKVPWESLVAGDEVQIHWRPQPYHTKWVLCRRGTKDKPI